MIIINAYNNCTVDMATVSPQTMPAFLLFLKFCLGRTLLQMISILHMIRWSYTESTAYRWYIVYMHAVVSVVCTFCITYLFFRHPAVCSHLAQKLHVVDTALPVLTNVVSITPWVRADYTRPPACKHIIKGNSHLKIIELTDGGNPINLAQTSCPAESLLKVNARFFDLWHFSSGVSHDW